MKGKLFKNKKIAVLSLAILLAGTFLVIPAGGITSKAASSTVTGTTETSTTTTETKDTTQHVTMKCAICGGTMNVTMEQIATQSAITCPHCGMLYNINRRESMTAISALKRVAEAKKNQAAKEAQTTATTETTATTPAAEVAATAPAAEVANTTPAAEITQTSATPAQATILDIIDQLGQLVVNNT